MELTLTAAFYCAVPRLLDALRVPVEEHALQRVDRGVSAVLSSFKPPNAPSKPQDRVAAPEVTQGTHQST